MRAGDPAAINRGERRGEPHRLVGALILLVMAIGCLILWVGIPIGVLWLLSKATDSFTLHLTLGLLLVPAAMVAFAPVLLWLNGLYLRVTGVLTRLEQDQREAGWERRIGGPLEPLLIVSLVIALVALVWFFFYAGFPMLQAV